MELIILDTMLLYESFQISNSERLDKRNRWTVEWSRGRELVFVEAWGRGRELVFVEVWVVVVSLYLLKFGSWS